MKFSTLCVGISVAINLVLLGTLARNVWTNGPAREAVEPPAGGDMELKAGADTTARAGRWEELQAGDRAAQVARLRAEGFPPAMIRAIMRAQVRAQFASRRKVLDTAIAAQPFWEGYIDPKLEAEQRMLAREERTALRDLLGPDLENGYAAKLRRMFPGLPADKLDEIAQIRERRDDRREEIFGAARNSMQADDGPKLDALEKALHADLAAALSPQELEAYELRESVTANQLGYRLTAFDPTEQEYRVIFKLQQDFNSQFGMRWGGGSAEQENLRRDGEKVLKEQIKAALGTGRYADYERTTDFSFQRTAQLVSRLNLPTETASELHAIQQSTQERVAGLRRTEASLTERAAQLAALRAETEATIAMKLGTSGLEAYRTNGGTWLNNLGPRPASPPRP